MVRAGKAFSALRAVFITHMHQDHVGGLPDLIKALVKYPTDGQRTDVYLPEDAAISALEHWVTAMHVKWPSPSVQLHVGKEGPFFDDGTLRVAAVPTGHMRAWNVPSYGFVLEAEGKRIVATGDLRGDFSDFPAAAREVPCDLCICEVTHYDPVKAVPVLRDSPIRRMVFTHVHNPWHGTDGEARLREILAPLPYPFAIAHDGDVFDV
jgi:ribonuclease BN (tRNA processing enzyme)